MVEGLLDIFADTRDQARAIVAIFISLMALSAVFINQWFATRRARKEKLIEKAEELFLAVRSASDFLRQYETNMDTIRFVSFPGEGVSASQSKREVNKNLESARMLASLYFSTLTNKIDQIQSRTISLPMRESTKLPGVRTELDYIHKELGRLQTEIINQMTKSMH